MKNTLNKFYGKYLLFDGVRAFPPRVEEGYLRPYESHVRVLIQLLYNVVDDVFRFPLEVLLKGLQPPGVIVGVRHDDHLEIQGTCFEEKTNTSKATNALYG